jgi:hypothetical protein
MWDTRTGEWTLDRKGQRLPRPANMGTPCESCPRGSPEREAETTLTKENWRTYEWWQEVQATCGACLPEVAKNDPLSRKLLAMIGATVKGHERTELLQALSVSAQLGLMRG